MWKYRDTRTDLVLLYRIACCAELDQPEIGYSLSQGATVCISLPYLATMWAGALRLHTPK